MAHLKATALESNVGNTKVSCISEGAADFGWTSFWQVAHQHVNPGSCYKEPLVLSLLQ